MGELAGQSVEQLAVVQFHRDVGGAGRQVDGPHRMALDGGLLTYREAVAEVRRFPAVARHEPVPAGLDEVTGELQVGAVAGLPEQLHQGHLDLRVTVDVVPAVLSEGGDEMIGEAYGDVQQSPVAGAPDLRDGGLDEVAGTVVLVAGGQVAVTPLTLDLDHRAEVAVRLLGGGDDGGHLALGTQQFLGRVAGVLPRRGLENLVDVGVHEDRSTGFALHSSRGDPQIVQVSGRLQPVPAR